MWKRVDAGSEEGAQLKKAKLQDTAKVYDDATLDDFRSKYSLSEIFPLISIPLLEELLDFLDIHQATRLCRVSPTWKAVLMKGPMRNHKTVVLQQPVGDHAFERLGSIVFLTPVWESTLFLLKPKSIEHFIFIGHFAHTFESFVCNHNNNLHIISESLNEITFCEDELDTSNTLLFHWPRLPKSVKHVNLINCTVILSRCRFAMSSEDEFIAAALPTLPLMTPTRGCMIATRKPPYGLDCTIKVFVPRLQFNRFVDDKEEDECRSESDVLEKKLDENNLMWPYPEEQLQWLLKTLDGLEGTVLQSVKNTDKACYPLRNYVDFWGFRQLDLISKVTFDGRKLGTLDLAFFGRLLVCMNKVKAIPGFQPPPFEFPDDLKYTRMSSD